MKWTDLLKSELFAKLDCFRLSLNRKLSAKAFESVVRAWKELDRPAGNRDPGERRTLGRGDQMCRETAGLRIVVQTCNQQARLRVGGQVNTRDRVVECQRQPAADAASRRV